MSMKTIFSLLLAAQICLYTWLIWVAIFQRDGHVPVPYIVLHIVAAINFLIALAGVGFFLLAKSSPPQVLWTLLVALPSILLVVYLYLLKFLR